MLRTLPVITLSMAVMLAGLVALAAQGTVDGTGEAQIKRGDKVAAKKLAIAGALKRCIEKVVGITIKSEFDSTMQETVKNNQNQFTAEVTDKISQRAEGFIEKYDVLKEWIEGDVMKVTVRATVYESRVKAEVKKLTELLIAAGNPKLMIIIQDVITSPEGKEEVSAESMLGSHIEHMLLQRGIEVRGKSAAKSVAGGSIRKYDRWAQETDNIAEMARKNGADILVFGRVEIKNKGEITNASFAALNGQTRIEISTNIRGINAATGELFSSKPEQMSSMGINIEKAMNRALRGRGRNLVKRVWDPLFEDLKMSFKETAAQGSKFVIQLKNVENFRKQGRKFVGMLRGLPSVSGVEHTFSSGKLSVELSCKCTPQELQDRIFDAIDTISIFENLDIDDISGKRLSFKL